MVREDVVKSDVSGTVTPAAAAIRVDASDYSAIVFVGGWGSPSAGPTSGTNYFTNDYSLTVSGAGENSQRAPVNNLVNEFLADDKYVAAMSPAPVAANGGGTRDGHWRESVFNTELMTG